MTADPPIIFKLLANSIKVVTAFRSTKGKERIKDFLEKKPMVAKLGLHFYRHSNVVENCHSEKVNLTF